MKIAWVSPLPPSPSGIADYSADLLPEVSKLAEVTVYTSEPEWGPHPDFDVRPFASLPGDLEGQPDMVPVYQQGNNPYHGFVYELAMSHPGLLVLHDVVLHHFMLDWAGRSQRGGPWYEKLLIEQYGRKGAWLFRFRTLGLASDFEHFLFPLSGPLMRASLGTIVHSQYAAELARMENPKSRITVIPHHSGIPSSVPHPSAHETRKGLGIPQDALVVGAFGYVSGPKQGQALVNAFALLEDDSLSGAYLVFVGADERRGELQALTRAKGLEERVRFTGYVDREQFYGLLEATDVFVALRYPSAGETSGTLSRALALGCCPVVADIGSFGELSDDMCLHVSLGEGLEERLARTLRKLANSPPLRRAKGIKAMEYASSVLDIKRCASLYVEAVESIHAGLPATRVEDETSGVSP